MAVYLSISYRLVSRRVSTHRERDEDEEEQEVDAWDEEKLEEAELLDAVLLKRERLDLLRSTYTDRNSISFLSCFLSGCPFSPLVIFKGEISARTSCSSMMYYMMDEAQQTTQNNKLKAALIHKGMDTRAAYIIQHASLARLPYINLLPLRYCNNNTST